MDEVDGCGASDRGGIAALIAIIKQTKTPIICICNDRQNKKLATLITYCYDLKFQTPQPKEVLTRLKLIAQNEKLTIDDDTL
jgi:replication factor C subunit 1